MAQISKHQTCPFCGYIEDPACSIWKEGEKEIFDCPMCHKQYQAEAKYRFLGWECSKKCESCGEYDEDCFCDESEVNA